MKKLFLLICLCVTTAAFSQTTKDTTANKEEEIERIFTTVQQPPEFPGGVSAWQQYLQKNLNTKIPTRNGAPIGRYTIIVGFIVRMDGSLSDIIAENDPGYGTAEEAKRVIKKGPKWQPAVQNGRVVNYRARQQITFVVGNMQTLKS